MQGVEIPEDWRITAERIVAGPGVVVVLGGTDSGKSTFCGYLGRVAFERGLRAALVDADIGQSRVGPPGWIGWAWFGEEGIGREEDLWFVGSFSPARHLADCVTGTFRMVMTALSRGAGLVVVDTTGLVAGRDGFQLKMAKLHCLRPGHVVAFRRDLEGSTLLELVAGSADWRTHLLDVPSAVRVRSREERRQYRLAQLQAHLVEAKEEEFRHPTLLVEQNRRFRLRSGEGNGAATGSTEPPGEGEWHGGLLTGQDSPVLSEASTAVWERKLCSLESEYGRCLGVGITLAVDCQRRWVRVRWRRHRDGQVRLIRLGDARVEALTEGVAD